MIKSFSCLEIKGIAAAVPTQIRKIESLKDSIMGDISRIIDSTGISQVRVTSENVTAGDLCLAAAKKLLSDLNISESEIDAVVMVTNSPDYFSPQTSHLIQAELNLRKDIPCLDLLSGCSGFVYGLFQSALLLECNCAKNVLLLVGETPTKVLSPKEPSTFVLFGDAGSAAIISGKKPGCISISSDGKGARHIRVPNSAFRVDPNEVEKSRILVMNGAEVFAFATREAPKAIDEILKANNLDISQIDFFVPHQANKFIVDTIVKRLNIDKTRVLNCLREFGNTGSGSPALNIVVNGKKLSDEDPKRVLISTFGVGLSIGTCLVDLSDTFISTLQEID